MDTFFVYGFILILILPEQEFNREIRNTDSLNHAKIGIIHRITIDILLLDPSEGVQAHAHSGHQNHQDGQY